MKIKVKKSGKLLSEGELTEILDGLPAEGISMIRDVYDPERESFSLVRGVVPQGHELFPLALKKFLEEKGYEVVEESDDRTEEELKKILDSFPDDNEDKADILNRLSEMSRLEKTLLLRELKKID